MKKLALGGVALGVVAVAAVVLARGYDTLPTGTHARLLAPVLVEI